jgi:hypothetical protein
MKKREEDKKGGKRRIRREGRGEMVSLLEGYVMIL